MKRWPLPAAALTAIMACRHDAAVPASSLPPAYGTPQHNLVAAAVADYDPGVDYFPDKTAFHHARQITISYHGHYKLARIVTRGMGESFAYALVQRGTPIPRLPADVRVVAVPVQRFSLGTYRYGRAADVLGVVDGLVGFGNHTHVTVPSIRQLFDSGRLARNFSPEAMANRQSEVHFEFFFPGELSRTNDVHARMGLRVVGMAEHSEATPLARAEWLKFFAMFFNREREASQVFEGIERAYTEVASLVPRARRPPRVLVGGPSEDGWQMHGGKNVQAQLIEDAGGRYVWADNTSEENYRTTSFEDALVRARTADVWILGPDASFDSRMVEATVSDPRYRFIPAVSAGRVFVGNRNFPDGPNPWWDEALVSPHLELADHVRMIHPEVTLRSDMTFYRPLTPTSSSRTP